ncbi:MAG: phosphoribosylformylglycinamidine cyclo-ligase, partial [Acidobacteria bacterium]|nr:phosphoribosylformylglycinamidine cyclo-ligase [Acidobacteriota bacterium]
MKSAPRQTAPSIRYADAGVSIDEADRAVGRIKKLAQRTFNRHVITDIGTFGAVYALGATHGRGTVLVSSADGVGTKLKVAFTTGIHNTVGKDLVNHCVNDIAV